MFLTVIMMQCALHHLAKTEEFLEYEGLGHSHGTFILATKEGEWKPTVAPNTLERPR
jgi:hypothetical protein